MWWEMFFGFIGVCFAIIIIVIIAEIFRGGKK